MKSSKRSMQRTRWVTATAAFWALAAGGALAQTTQSPSAPSGEAVDPFATPAPSAPVPLAETAPAAMPTTFSDAITNGHLILEARARYEFVDQANRMHDATAATLRTRFGWETDSWRDFKGLLEFEDVRQIGGYDYYDGVHPHAGLPAPNGGYPQVSDPEVTELNRLQVTWSPTPTLQATFGRQRIIFDDQRFVGNSGWRQDEVTFDAARLDWSTGNFKASYAYLGRINRFLGEAQDWDSDSHIVNATYAFAEPLKVTGFAYLLDLKQSAANSRATYGLRATGRSWVSLVGLNYALTYATQSDYGNNPAKFNLDFRAGEISAQYDIFTARLDYESLQGDGVRGFSTPLATLHAFQGWADLFLTTPAKGINDANIQLNVKPRFRRDHFFNIDLTARWHNFTFERGGADIGAELDAQAMVALTPHLSAGLKYADFQTDIPTSYPDTTKGWFTLEYRY